MSGPPDVLVRILDRKQAEIAERRAVVGTAELRERLGDSPPLRGFTDALRARIETGGAGVIAEIKKASPSKGLLRADFDPPEIARSYAAGGAACLSVLTDVDHFGGSAADLQAARAAVPLPVLRKDFTVHPHQLVEAHAAGASAALLIVAVVGEALPGYLRACETLGLDALVEVHDETELDLALAAAAPLIGVNNRDLRSLEVDLATAPRLLRRARAAGHDGPLVAESGYRSAAELDAVRGLADAVLVGTSLAGSGDLRTALERLRGSGA